MLTTNFSLQSRQPKVSQPAVAKNLQSEWVKDVIKPAEYHQNSHAQVNDPAIATILLAKYHG